MARHKYRLSASMREAVVLDLEVADEVDMSKAELLEHLSKASEGGVRTQGAASSLAGHNN